MRKTLYLDVVGVRQEHGEAINAHAPASGRWQPVLECSAEGLVDSHGLIVTLIFGLAEENVTIAQG